jgi:hypothetical protein
MCRNIRTLTTAPPKNPEAEAAKKRIRWEQRVA